LTRARDPEIASSRDVVAHWMMLTNAHCAGRMAARGEGIFRTSISAPLAAPLPAACKWLRTAGAYVAYADLAHAGAVPYTHITSPIRRLVDAANQALLCGHADAEKLVSAAHLAEINRSSRAAKKIQRDCELVALCASRPEVMAREHRGTLFARREDGRGAKYSVFLEDLRMICSVRVSEEFCELADGTAGALRLFLFEAEHSAARKVRAQWLGTLGVGQM